MPKAHRKASYCKRALIIGEKSDVEAAPISYSLPDELGPTRPYSTTPVLDELTKPSSQKSQTLREIAI